MQITVTLVIVIINVVVSMLAFNNNALMARLLFDPIRITNNQQYYRFITSGFVHADIAHLAFNMLSLYMFGKNFEEMYVIIFGSSASMYIKPYSN